MEVCVETQKRDSATQTGLKSEGWEEAGSGELSGVLAVNLSLSEEKHQLAW